VDGSLKYFKYKIPAQASSKLHQKKSLSFLQDRYIILSHVQNSECTEKYFYLNMDANSYIFFSLSTMPMQSVTNSRKPDLQLAQLNKTKINFEGNYFV